MKIASDSHYLSSTPDATARPPAADTAMRSFASRLASAQAEAASETIATPAPSPKPGASPQQSGYAPPITSYQMVSIALNGYLPVITDKVQHLVDSITAKYRGQPQDDGGKAMWDELAANGVSPEMITANAAYFYAPDGSIVPRSVAVGAARPGKPS